MAVTQHRKGGRTGQHHDVCRPGKQANGQRAESEERERTPQTLTARPRSPRLQGKATGNSVAEDTQCLVRAVVSHRNTRKTPAQRVCRSGARGPGGPGEIDHWWIDQALPMRRGPIYDTTGAWMRRGRAVCRHAAWPESDMSSQTRAGRGPRLPHQQSGLEGARQGRVDGTKQGGTKQGGSTRRWTRCDTRTHRLHGMGWVHPGSRQESKEGPRPLVLCDESTPVQGWHQW